jgi:transcriptional regulator with XRE-family HTH domain
MNNDNAAIGQRVRATREARHLSQRKAAQLVGRAPSWLSRIEAGRLRLERRSDVDALAAVLRVTPQDLLGAPYDLPPIDAGVELVRDSIPELRRAMLDRPRRTGAHLDQLDDEVGHLRYLHHIGRAERATAAAVATLDGLRGAASGAHSKRVGRLTVLAGYYTAASLQAVGRHEMALLMTTLMGEAADAAGDPVTRALVAIKRAYGLAQLEVGAFSAALDVASSAADELLPVGGEEAAAAQGHLQLAAAFAAGSLRRGDEATARLRAARELAGRVTGPTVFGKHLGFGLPNVAIHEVSTWVELGDVGRVARSVGEVRPEDAPYPSRAAALLADRGRAYATLRRDEQAITDLCAADQLYPAWIRQHALNREAVTGLLARPQRPDAGRELRALAYRMGIPH